MDGRGGVDSVAEFCRRRGVAAQTRFTVSPNLNEALWTIRRKGPDQRWRTVAGRGDGADVPVASKPSTTTSAERQIFDTAVRIDGTFTGMPKPWFLGHTLTSLTHWAKISSLLRDAYTAGVGWIIPAHKEVVLVRLPRMAFAEGRTDVLHDDTGRLAVEWSDGSGWFYLHGKRFDGARYHKVIRSQLSLSEVCLLPDSDQRSIALSYMTFDDLVRKAGARLIDIGEGGTRLYQLRLPREIARDRPAGYGGFDYFIFMRDASHPEREFIEWVDPHVGVHGDAELCQAHAFGISLQDWLSIEQAG